MSPGDLIAKLMERWQALNLSQKIIVALLALGVVVCLFFLGRLALQPAYAELFTGLEPQDAGAIVEELQTMKVPYQLTNQGTTIKVPEKQVYEVRNQLASSGALGGSDLGFELFDQNKFGQTDFEQQVAYQRALQGELRRTLVKMEGVEQASVHLVLPEKSVFISEQSPPSAAVALKLKPGARLQSEKVQGICDLFVGSVEGLQPENIHVIDTEGRVLSDNFKSSDPNVDAARISLDQHAAQREYEKELEKRVQQMLTQILGQNQAVVMVTADLDFNRRQTNSSIYTNPDELKISEQNITEEGTGIGYGGVAGTGTNVTTMPNVQGNGTSSYSREENTINYQVSTQEETEVSAPGRVRRLSASVVVNEQNGPIDEEKVRSIVVAAIGRDLNRGDQINVTSMAFDNSYQQKVENEMAKYDAAALRESLYKYALAGAVIFIVLVALFLWRRRGAQRVIGEEAGIVEDMVMPVMSIQPEEVQPGKKQQLRELTKKNPEDIAEVLKAWLKD